jgi:uncharacterized phage protein (TIGR02220 family)
VTIQTAFRLDKKLVDKLKKYCETEGRSQTWVANKALNDYLAKPTGIVSYKGETWTPNLSPSLVNKPSAKKPIAVAADDTADKVIDYLNSQAGTRYKHTDTNRKLINVRLKEYTKREVFDVITKKANEWRGTEMERYLRPSTLFNATKFEEYLNQKVIDKLSTGRNTQESTRTRDKTIHQQLNDRSWAANTTTTINR